MTYSGLVSRARRKGVSVSKHDSVYTLADSRNDSIITTVPATYLTSLVMLEDEINWVDVL